MIGHRHWTKTGLYFVLACTGLIAGGIGTATIQPELQGALAHFLTAKDIAQQPASGPGLGLAYDRLSEDAGLQLIEISALKEWAEQRGTPAQAAGVRDLSSRMLEEFGPIVLMASLDAYIHEYHPAHPHEQSVQQLWQVYHLLSDRQLSFRREAVALRSDIFREQGVQITPRETVNPFDRKRKP
jgi:hypothetical protein